MLERAGVVRPGELSRSSVHRLLHSHGISSRPIRGPSAERRSFLTEHAGDLWIGDALHLPDVVLAPGGGSVRKAILFSEIDCCTRYVIESRFVIAEGERPEDHETGLKAALRKAGLARAYYVDRGSAYRAGSLRIITGELGIRLLFAEDAEAKGAIERWHRTWREEVGDELQGRVLTLAELNAFHWAWLEQEYHARKHDTTGRAPREHWLSEIAAGHVRPLLRGLDLDEVFLHRATRHVRKDGTLSFRGQQLEVRAELSGQTVELRFDPDDREALPKVYVEQRFFCDTVPLDRHKNANAGKAPRSGRARAAGRAERP